MSRFYVPAPGELRNRVLFQTRTEGKDAAQVINARQQADHRTSRLDPLRFYGTVTT